MLREKNIVDHWNWCGHYATLIAIYIFLPMPLKFKYHDVADLSTGNPGPEVEKVDLHTWRAGFGELDDL